MEENTENIATYYRNLIRKYGCNYKACDYGKEGSQLTKFQILSKCTDFDGKMVLDIGCGYAAYADYLMKNFSDVQYIGVELCPEMIEFAMKKSNILQIIEGNFIDLPCPEVDVITANGIFYLLGNDASSIMKKIILKMWRLAREAVAFNSLSSWRTNKEPSEFYADPIEIINYCRQLTPWVVLRHDYHPGDFTIYMYKEQRA